MFVMGIDPGLSRCGYGMIGLGGGERVGGGRGVPAVVSAGVIETPRSLPLPQRLRTLQVELRELFAELRPTVVAVERVFFQVNALTAMSVGQASGLALAAAAEAGCDVAEYTANEVKQALVGYGSATKGQVQRMVASVLGLTEVPSPPDVADALALAVCHFNALPLRQAVAAAAGDGWAAATAGGGAG